MRRSSFMTFAVRPGREGCDEESVDDGSVGVPPDEPAGRSALDLHGAVENGEATRESLQLLMTLPHLGLVLERGLIAPYLALQALELELELADLRPIHPAEGALAHEKHSGPDISGHGPGAAPHENAHSGGIILQRQQPDACYDPRRY